MQALQPVGRSPDGAAGTTLAEVQTHTHHLTFTATEVRKRYVSWDDGEADREWICLSVLAERRYGPSTHLQTVAGWLSDTNDLSECRDPHLVADAVDAALDWLRQPGQLAEPQLTALGIADLNPANVLWDGTACRLVDFEDGGLTDPAYELADHIEHIAGRLPRVYDAPALVDAVGLSADERARMEAYRPVWAAFWLAMLLPGNGGFGRNPPRTTEAQASHLLSILG